MHTCISTIALVQPAAWVRDDLLVCARCIGRMRVLAAITGPAVVDAYDPA